jgi:hypothetical protein
VGRLYDIRPNKASRAALAWHVGRLEELRVLTDHLDEYPPRGRVRRIYETWRELVLLTTRRSRRRLFLARRVRERRAYKPGLEAVERPDAAAARRLRCIAVLRNWAAATDGPRTATRYAMWRRESAAAAPRQDTISAAFGSWIAALEAAGLCARGCRSEVANAAASARAAAKRPSQIAANRAAILAAVRQCAIVVGRPPRATEFFAWRNQFVPAAPSQATLYRAFPGGWATVLDALEALESRPDAVDLARSRAPGLT